MFQWILKIKAQIKLNKARKKANYAWLMTGRKHYVLMAENARLIIVNRDSLKEYNRHAKKKISSFELSSICLYMTKQGKV